MAEWRGAMEDVAVTRPSPFWRSRRVLLTGHTGFKGAWMALWLKELGAEVTGYALPPEDGPSLYGCLAPWDGITSILADINDLDSLSNAVADAAPEIVIHMAAQALVRRSYAAPIDTFATNIMGTANLLTACQRIPTLRTILVITSDKVYDNRDHGRAFCEDDPLAGDDPYSASKAAAEMIVRSWRSSFMRGPGAPTLAVARAGNVIGGGDWAEDRLVPDVIRAGLAGRPVVLRYPDSTRPWQHVLDVVYGYMAYAERLTLASNEVPTALNFGPDQSGIAAHTLVEALQAEFAWTDGWRLAPGKALPEKSRLNLDHSRAAAFLGWRARFSANDAVKLVADWHRAHANGDDMRRVSLQQIADYTDLVNKELVS